MLHRISIYRTRRVYLHREAWRSARRRLRVPRLERTVMSWPGRRRWAEPAEMSHSLWTPQLEEKNTQKRKQGGSQMASGQNGRVSAGGTPKEQKAFADRTNSGPAVPGQFIHSKVTQRSSQEAHRPNFSLSFYQHKQPLPEKTVKRSLDRIVCLVRKMTNAKIYREYRDHLRIRA